MIGGGGQALEEPVQVVAVNESSAKAGAQERLKGGGLGTGCGGGDKELMRCHDEAYFFCQRHLPHGRRRFFSPTAVCRFVFSTWLLSISMGPRSR